MAQSFEYHSLQHHASIRLLRVASGEGPVFCSIVEAAEERPPYFALSYTWDSPNQETLAVTSPTVASNAPFLIFCEGQTLEVTENAYRALQQLQKLDVNAEGHMQGLRYCWIDAICINQADILERNSQVAIMGNIYANASLVLIWLGESDADSSDAVLRVWRFGSALQREFEDPDEFPSDFPAIEFNDARIYEQLRTEQITLSQWQSILRLFTKRWFSRGWVMQEFILARKAVVLYDGQYLDSGPLVFFTVFFLASGWINSMPALQGSIKPDRYNENIGLRQMSSAIAYNLYGTEGPEHRSCRRILQNVYKAQSQVERLYAFLQNVTIHTRPRQVGDLRDKVFAPLALVTHFVPDAIMKSESFHWMRPDYTLSIEDVYITFTAFLVRNTSVLIFLSFVNDRSVKKLQSLPSWVPDFSTNGAAPLAMLDFGATDHWKASGHRGEFLSPRILKVTGFLPDDIVEVAPQMEEIIKHHNVTAWFKLACNLINERPESSANQPPVEMLWRTLIADLETEPYVPGSISDLAVSFRSFILLEMTALFINCQRQNIEPTAFWRENVVFTTIVDAYPHYLPSPEDIIEMALFFSSYTRIENPVWPEKLAPLTEFRHKFWMISSIRKLARTRRGYLALAPAFAQPGDMIGFLQGAQVPFILRKLVGENQGKFELIGEAYIHGVMKGEIAEWETPVFEDIILL